MDRVIQAYKRGDLVLVLGAGCSLSATNYAGENLPLGSVLAEEMSDTFGLEYYDETLPEVLQALRADHSRQKLDNALVERLRVQRPGQEHAYLASLRLRRIYCLNIDDAVEKAFQRHSDYKTRIFYRNDAPRAPSILFDETQIVKLHGCVSRPDDGFIFTLSEYAEAHADLPLWYSELAADCRTQTVVFVGTEANEPLLLDAIKRLGSALEDIRTFLIIPHISPARRKIISSTGMQWIKGTFQDLVSEMKNAHCDALESLELAKATEPALATILDSDQTVSKDLLKKLGDVVPVRNTISASKSSSSGGIRAFYEGYSATKSDFDDLVPAKLAQTERLVNSIEEAIQHHKRLVVVTGPAGTGKTTALHLASRDLVSKDSTRPVFFLNKDALTPLDTIATLSKTYDQTVIVFVESFFENRDTIRQLIVEEKHIKNILIVVAEPLMTWSNYIQSDYSPDEYKSIEFSEITRSDALNILNKLEKFGPWTVLSKLKAEERLKVLLEKSQNQLLVGLLEATRGRGYSEIIRQDFESITSTESRFLLSVSSVCTMFGAGVPMDVAIRAFGAKFPSGKFGEAIAGLDGTAASRGNFIEARHPVYASAVFENLLSAEQKYDAIYHVLLAFSAYGSPVTLNTPRDKARIFKGILNYRFLSRTFENHKTKAISLFEEFETIFHSDGAYWLQYGLMLRKFGEQDDALTMLQRSVQAYKSNFAQHALGLQYFILAGDADSKAQTREYMEKAIDTLRSIQSDVRYNDAYPLTTLTKGHITTLLRLDDKEGAMEKAESYHREIDAFQRGRPRDRVIAELKTQLLVLLSTGMADEKFWHF